MAADTAKYDRASFLITKERHEALKQMVEDLGLRSVGELMSMLGDTRSTAFVQLRGLVAEWRKLQGTRDSLALKLDKLSPDKRAQVLALLGEAE